MAKESKLNLIPVDVGKETLAERTFFAPDEVNRKGKYAHNRY